MKGIKKALSYITNVEYAIMVVTFVAMVIAYFISVVNRNFIKASMPWTEEVAMYSMIYMALLGTEVGLRDGTQVAVTAVIEKLHGVTKKIVSIIEQIILEIFSFVMLKAGLALFFQAVTDRTDHTGFKSTNVSNVLFTGPDLCTDPGHPGSCAG